MTIHVNDATIALWREAYRAGASYRQIAEGAGVSRDTVIRRCNMTSRIEQVRQYRRRIAELERRHVTTRRSPMMCAVLIILAASLWLAGLGMLGDMCK